MSAKKGNLQGQTTLAAKIVRWQTLINNYEPHSDTLPHLKEALARLEQVLARARELRERQQVLKADVGDNVVQRNSLLTEGDDLFTRLTLGLQSLHGPKSERLREFGLKPRRNPGRPAKAAPSPAPETPTGPSAAPHAASEVAAA